MATAHAPTHSSPTDGIQDEAAAYQEDSDEYYDDIFDDDEDLTSANPNDLTKAYNRQRRANEVSADPNASKSNLPKTNSQRPQANTSASVDDQIASLSKHANKLRIGAELNGLTDNRNGTKDRANRATSEQVLDPRTRMLLLQMINRDVITEVNGCLSTGKEANVYHASSNPREDHQETTVQHRAIKVYKTAIMVFKDREKYVTGDFRFKNEYKKGSNNRAKVKVWAEKEMKNLRSIYESEIPCPEPLYLRLHVLVMGFLGDRKGTPAPKLKDITFDPAEADKRWHELYVQLLGYMRVLYQKCGLVHGDLSEYNLLYHQDKIWMIDVSQSVEHGSHPSSLDFLRMDIKNVSDFFARKSVDTLSERTIFDFIRDPKLPVRLELIPAAIEELYANRPTDQAEDEHEKEVDNAVFRSEYIPQTLEQVVDIERDAEQIGQGGQDGLIYKGLLAQKAMPEPEDAGFTPESDEESGDEETTDEERADPFAPKQPRGKRFEDKDEKKEHKKKVKEEKAAKRKEKMPKHVKKSLTSGKKKH